MTNHPQIFKTNQGHAVTLPDSVIHALNLKPGDILIHEVVNGSLILKKASQSDFSKEWHRFFEQGGDYTDYETHSWGEASERETW